VPDKPGDRMKHLSYAIGRLAKKIQWYAHTQEINSDQQSCRTAAPGQL
jgi:hypothetical protein